MTKLRDQYITKNQNNRLYKLDKPLIGLTGGIGTGKSTVAQELKQKGFFVIGADELVHDVYESQEAIHFVASMIPQAVSEQGHILFQKLREHAFSNPSLLKDLEDFIYQRLPQAFCTLAKKNSSPTIIYDVPLLFEKKMEEKFDLTITVYAPPQQQIARAMKRDGTSQDIIEAIIAKQIPIDQKKAMSDFTIDNSRDLRHLNTEITNFLTAIVSS